jgi:IS605 OrfB family transposase
MLGAGSKGHGKQRRYEHYDALGEKRANVVKTFCQQIAARVCREAETIGAGVIVLENYGGIEPANERHLRRVLARFPLYQLKQAIANAAEVRGLAVVEQPAEYISTTCPACSNADVRQHNHATGTFHCRACAFERPADFVAALNMLRRSGYDAKVWDERLEAVAKLARSLKDEPEAAK